MAEKTPIVHDSNKDLVRGELFLFIGDAPIAFASSCGLDVTAEEIDISNKMCGDWAAALPGKKSFTLSCECLLTRKEGAMSFDTLLAKMIANETVDFFYGAAKVDPATKTNTGGAFALDTAQKNYKGTAMITSLSLKSDNGQIASSSISLKGVGALEPVDMVSSGGVEDPTA